MSCFMNRVPVIPNIFLKKYLLAALLLELIGANMRVQPIERGQREAFKLLELIWNEKPRPRPGLFLMSLVSHSAWPAAGGVEILRSVLYLYSLRAKFLIKALKALPASGEAFYISVFSLYSQCLVAGWSCRPYASIVIINPIRQLLWRQVCGHIGWYGIASAF
jgi:hypothetical protein